MATYNSPTLSGYNSNPPPDDGTESAENEVTWAVIKEKLTDPLKDYSEAVDSATGLAFAEQTVFVNNANGEPTVNSTVLDIVADVTQATWESVGATGATNTWAAMASVPAGADWIELKLGALSTATSSADVDVDLFTRQTGSSVAIMDQTQVGKLRTTTAAATTVNQAVSFFKVQIDSNGHFDLYWDAAANNAAELDLYLTGYGWN